MGWALVIYVACVLLRELAYGAVTPCEKVDDCSCKLQNSDKQINIRSLGYSDKSAPRFGFKRYDTAFDWEYAYNPCYPWSDGTSSCKSIVGCQRIYNNHSATYDIADVTATWMNDGSFYYIKYSHGPRITVVMLDCDATAKTPTLRLNIQYTNFYNFTLTSECCCPGTCNPPGISAGSVICIIASVLIVVYLIGGVLFMKFVRHAEGSELIPNKEIWVGLFGYIKEGFIFVFTCGKTPGYTTFYPAK